MTYYGKTNIGQVRKNNEDTFIAQTIWNGTHLLCAVIDGNYGEDVAAEVTRDTIISHLEDFPLWNIPECLQQAVVDANNEVVRYQYAIPKYRSMGCVISMAVLNVKDRLLCFVHVGDTRIYSFYDGQLNILTQDDAQGRLVTFTPICLNISSFETNNFNSMEEIGVEMAPKNGMSFS